MSRFLRRLRPDGLAGQIALVVLAVIVLFHLASTTANYLGSSEGRRPVIEPGEFIATALWAIDAASIPERPKILATLNKATPWIKFSLREAAPNATADSEESGDLKDLKAHLWEGAQVSAVTESGEKNSGDFGVALRKGGYAVATPSGMRAFARRGALWTTRSGAAPFSVRLLERSALFFLFCATILTVWVSSAVVAPLVKLAREAEQFPDESNRKRLIEEAGPREVRDLTRAINRMQSRIQAMIEARSQALAAISHDLRTIITRIRLRSEFISDDALKSKMLRDAELMDSMLYKNLQHLRDASHAPERGLIDLDSVLQTVCDQYVDLGHDVTYRGGQHQIILGSLTEMQRVFNNLVENAVTHAKEVVVTLQQPSPDVIRVDVADDGPGIPANIRNRVLEPFVRGEPARNMNEHVGFGLGLSIVRSLVEELGGSLQLLDREPHGLIARVVLPRAFAKS